MLVPFKKETIFCQGPVTCIAILAKNDHRS